MKLNAQIRLNINVQKITVRVVSRTYEKATFDIYLAASIALRRKSEQESDAYIDDIAGKGSLNPYLKRLVAEYAEYSREDLEKIMADSKYPKEKTDRSQTIIYYPVLGVAEFNGHHYSGDIEGILGDAKKDVRYEGTLISVEFEEGNTHDESDMFDLVFDDDSIKVELKPGLWAEMTDKQFAEAREGEQEAKPDYPGIFHQAVKGEGWHTFGKGAANTLLNATKFIEEGDVYLVINAGLKKWEACQFHGLYLYRESLIPFEDSGEKLCGMALDALTASRRIYEIKAGMVKSIVALVPFDKAQATLNDLLGSKTNSELARFALERYLCLNMTEGWCKKALEQMKKEATKEQLPYVYSADPSLFELSDILVLPRNMLTKEDLEAVEKHDADRAGKIHTIQELHGLLTSSALRERSKALPSCDETKRFHKLVNKFITHSKVNIEERTDEAIDNELRWAIEIKELMPILERMLREVEGKK